MTDKSSVAEPAAAQVVEGMPLDNTSVQRQVEALWDAMKWMEDRMEKIDAERREELQEASRAAAQNTAKVRELPDLLTHSSLDAFVYYPACAIEDWRHFQLRRVLASCTVTAVSINNRCVCTR